MSNEPTQGVLEVLCEHRCLKRDGHDGPHFYGYNLPPDKDVVSLAECERRVQAERQWWINACAKAALEVEWTEPAFRAGGHAVLRAVLRLKADQ